MNLRSAAIAFVENDGDFRDLELAGFPNTVSGLHLEEITHRENAIQMNAFECAAPPALEAAGEVRIRHAGDQARIRACRLAEEEPLEIPIDYVDTSQIARAQR